MSLGEQISALRKKRGWTQATLAQASKLSPSTIAMYETNRRLPDDTTLHKLAAALQVSVSDLANVPESTDMGVAATEQPKTRNSKKQIHSSDESTSLKSTDPSPSTADLPKDAHGSSSLTNLPLTRDEARIILFLRMNPQCVPFIESYIVSDPGRRDQLEKTWRLIHQFPV